ncbi:MAG: PAS domain-containing sensor histidine kinase, partial [Anaerolineae bacterium]
EELTHPEDVAATADVLQGLMDGRLQTVRFEKRFLHKSGSVVWADVTIAIARESSGKPLYTLTAIIDVTARKQADLAVQDVKQHLQRNIEMERLRLAQELHDAPLQELYAVIYRLEELRSHAEPASAQMLEEVIENIQKTLSSLRATASELRPPALSRFGLEKAARSYIQDFCDKHPAIQVRYALARDGQLLPEEVRLVLFRVMQESLANVLRHSGATEANVRFNFDAEEARIEVEDNGRGFQIPETWVGLVRAGHYGLAGMGERVSAAGGTLRVESKPGRGTVIRVVVPYGRV